MRVERTVTVVLTLTDTEALNIQRALRYMHGRMQPQSIMSSAIRAANAEIAADTATEQTHAMACIGELYERL